MSDITVANILQALSYASGIGALGVSLVTVHWARKTALVQKALADLEAERASREGPCLRFVRSPHSASGGIGLLYNRGQLPTMISSAYVKLSGAYEQILHLGPPGPPGQDATPLSRLPTPYLLAPGESVTLKYDNRAIRASIASAMKSAGEPILAELHVHATHDEKPMIEHMPDFDTIWRPEEFKP